MFSLTFFFVRNVFSDSEQHTRHPSQGISQGILNGCILAFSKELFVYFKQSGGVASDPAG